MFKLLKFAVISFCIIIAFYFWMTNTPKSQAYTDDIKYFFPNDSNEKYLTNIPREFGRLVDVKLFYLDRNHNMAELWFEADDKTIRIVSVNKGKSPDFKSEIDNRVRVIPRK